MKKKGTIKYLLTMILFAAALLIALPATEHKVYAANGVYTKLISLKSRFPDYTFWNHQVTSGNNGDQLMSAWSNGNKTFAESYANTITSNPCKTHNGTASSGQYDCNVFDGATQCDGFARKIFYEVFGVRMTNTTRRYDTANVSVGDYIRISGHSGVVLTRSGNYFTLAECNFSGGTSYPQYNCQIRWGTVTYNISQIQYFCHASNYDTINNPEPAAPGRSTVTVTAGSSVSNTTISWTASSNTTSYNLYLDLVSGSTRTSVKRLSGVTQRSLTLQLSAGTYEVYVESCNSGSKKTASYVNKFTVTAHTHKYTTKITKATLSANGVKKNICSCGKVKSQTVIYYPKTISLSTTTYTYNSLLTRKPSVTVKGSNGKTISSSNYTVTYPSGRKNTGCYTVKITFKGNYSGTAKRSFNIVPAAPSISSLTAKAGGFTAKWKQGSAAQVSGYQIQYAVNSSFTSADTVTVSGSGTTSRTISNIKGNTRNYVRIRSYKTTKNSSGTSIKVYSKWSAVKQVVTKANNSSWVYSSTLPSSVTSKNYSIQYKYTFKKQSYTKLGSDWTLTGSSTVYNNSGSSYWSTLPLTTSSTRQLLGYKYYHWCSGSTGTEVNFEQTSKFTHYDEITNTGAYSVYKSTPDGDDSRFIAYFLNNSSGTRAYCTSDCCNAAYGTHGSRSYVWYRMYQYQNKVAQTLYSYTKTTGWVSSQQSGASSVTYRYKLK